jgi:deoxyribonucleoside regulator
MFDVDSRYKYLAWIASLYYDHGKSQQEIADEMGITRSAISRLLSEARHRGIVEILVHYPWRTNPQLEEALKKQFPSLKEIKVLMRENKSYEDMVQGIGVLASKYFNEIVKPGMTIGISWGTALYQMIKSLRPTFMGGLEVVQLIGATGSENISTDGPVLAQLLSQRLACPCHYLHAPLIIDSEAGRDALLQERTIQETLDRARQADIALIGIGTTDPQLYSLLRAGYVSLEDMECLHRAGAVGDICGQHYDIHGNVLDVDINRLLVGINLDDLAKIDTVIGVAGGDCKSETILGALRGRHINVLITDERAARRALELIEKD